jgi:hypothetical protein
MAGAPVGEQRDLAAFASDKPGGAGASPLSEAAPDARPLRGHRAKVRHAKAQMAKADEGESASEPETTKHGKRVKAKGKSQKVHVGAAETKRAAARHADKKVTHHISSAAKPEAKKAVTHVAKHGGARRGGGAKEAAKKPEQ